MYFVYDRLPEIAYQLGVLSDVRFGGGRDEPNSIALFCAFDIPFVLTNSDLTKINKFILCITYIGILILTWLVTGGIFVHILYYMYNIFSSQYVNAEYLNYFIDSKTASVADHMRGWNISDLNTLSAFGL